MVLNINNEYLLFKSYTFVSNFKRIIFPVSSIKQIKIIIYKFTLFNIKLSSKGSILRMFKASITPYKIRIAKYTESLMFLEKNIVNRELISISKSSIDTKFMKNLVLSILHFNGIKPYMINIKDKIIFL